MRPVTIREKPNFHPYVCIVCGVGGPPREWFVDIGINLDNYFNPVIDGTVFFCNECWDSVQVAVAQQIQIWRRDREEWTGTGRVEPTYNWEQKEENGTGTPEPDSTIDGHDQSPEPDDRESEPTDSGDADSTDDTSEDESARRAFAAILGDDK